MAVKRINLMDAVDERAARVSRGRTALARRGTVLTAPVNGIASITLGGGPVDAVCPASVSVNTGDEVILLADTDAFWIVGVFSTAIATGDTLFTPSANATVNSVYAIRQGRLVCIQFNLRLVNAVTSDATGNFNDVNVGTINPTMYRPVASMHAVGATTGLMLDLLIATSGACSVTLTSAQSQTIAANTAFGVQATYIGA